MKKLVAWLTALTILVVGFGTVYAAVQQAQRSAANSPQIQVAEDAAAALDHGDLPATLVGSKVDVAKSLAPFTIIYDKTGRVVLGSGYLNNKVPSAPVGILKASGSKDYHAVTWQPQKNVRIAAVTVSSDKYYVLSGRNLKEVEKNEDVTLQITLLGLIISLGLFGFIFVLRLLKQDY